MAASIATSYTVNVFPGSLSLSLSHPLLSICIQNGNTLLCTGLCPSVGLWLL